MQGDETQRAVVAVFTITIHDAYLNSCDRLGRRVWKNHASSLSCRSQPRPAKAMRLSLETHTNTMRENKNKLQSRSSVRSTTLRTEAKHTIVVLYLLRTLLHARQHDCLDQLRAYKRLGRLGSPLSPIYASCFMLPSHSPRWASTVARYHHQCHVQDPKKKTRRFHREESASSFSPEFCGYISTADAQISCQYYSTHFLFLRGGHNLVRNLFHPFSLRCRARRHFRYMEKSLGFSTISPWTCRAPLLTPHATELTAETSHHPSC